MSDESGWRFPELLPTPSSQRSQTHSHIPSEPLERERLVEVFKNERGQIAQSRRLPFLPFQHLAELCLTPRPSQKQNQGLCDGHSDCVPLILLHQCQHKVNARCDSRRSPYATVAEKDAIVDDSRFGESLSQHVNVVPMSRRAASVQETGFTKHKCSGTDRDQGRDISMALPKPLYQARFARRQLACGCAAGHNDDIGRADVRHVVERLRAS